MKEYNQKMKKEFIQQESLFSSLINFKEYEFSSILTTGLAKIETFCKFFYPLRESPANVVNLIERNGQLRITK